MAGCCGCCSALKPRYKRLVDNIFPANPEDGLQKNNMAQLTFFAVSSPDKLDKIGQYMEQRLSREVHRHKIEYVFIAMEACDQLLKSCHAQSLNLFVESFLKMVQKLLESEEPELQILATNSFVKFANIEEDTPSYHRRYDFFVQRFSTMCHNNNPDQEMRTRIRSVGLRGLQGVVRKTVTDDLQVNIWDPIHMDKIVPSLLFNMHDSSRESSAEVESPRDEEHPSYVAENVLRDLVCRAAYGNIKSSITPVLVHLDNHKLWQPNSFAKKCFKIIMYSIQAQHGYLVIQMLMSHLDKHTHSDPMIKAGIIGVLYETVIISVGGTIGPSVLEVFNNLLRHLSISLDRKSENEERRKAEKIFEEAIINTIGEFANSLPDFQKIEIMMFILGKFPQFTNDDDICGPMDTQLQIHLLKTLLKVATRYKTVVMQNAFPHEFMHPLLQISRLDDPGMRITVQEILQTLIDRNGNSNKLNRVYIPKNISELELRIEKSSRQDIMFMKKNGLEFYWFLYENMQMLSNTVENFEALYCTMGLIYIELGENDILIELIRLALDIQQTVMNNSSLPLTHKCAIHALIAAYLNLISQSTDLPDLRQYIQKVIKTREKEAPHLLPNFAYNRTNRPHSFKDLESSDLYPTHDVLKDSWLFDHNAISKNLTDSGLDTARLSSPLTQKPFGLDLTEMQSVSDIQSINIDIESVDGSPVFGRKSDEEITVESLKRMLVEDNLSERLDKDRRRTEIHNSFRQAPFEELIARSEAKSPYHNKLNEILDMEHTPNASPISFEMQFPDLFVY
ncbi:protein EFR3 homolog B-like isoform X2 [Gigantopelta aegis]|uniref:protein EFR3 homolog B-like isoform X2 n=1 Tax=Gigantopelta aegis TaxID=1735272 RepID=UPI001B88E06F|nr:protein EFR3 homolog B-like isoform X2 [Gigantopelta aegis]